MKTKTPMQQWIPLAGLGLALAGSNVLASSDVWIGPGATRQNGDPTDTTIYQWHGDWGSGPGTLTYDPTMSPNAQTPGSIEVTFTGDGSGPINSYNFISMTPGWNPGWIGDGDPTKDYDLSAYAAVSFDINVNFNTSSNSDIPVTFIGNFETDQLYSGNGQNPDYGAKTNGWGLGIYTPGWHHLRIPFTVANTIANARMFCGYEWCQPDATHAPVHLDYHLANIKLEGVTTQPQPPSFTGRPLKRQGFMMDFGAQDVSQGIYNRQGIHTTTTHPWIGNATAGNPVTYSMTVVETPNLSVYSNFQANLFIAPSAKYGNPENNGSNVCWLKILGNSDGTATASVHWKTNSPLSFTMLYNTTFTNGLAAGLLGTVQAPSMVGTWSIKFTGSNSFTVLGPSVSTNFTIPQSWVDVWNADNDSTTPGDAYAYFGSEATLPIDQGQIWLSSVSSAGDPSPVTYTFLDQPDTTVWTLDGSQNAVVNTNSWLFSWTLPASYYNLVGTATLNDPSWVTVTNPLPTPIYRVGTNQHAVVAAANFPSVNQSFFTLVRTVATGLQVLMPGETNAPGTLTGKVGAPTAQHVGATVNVIVNAVDSHWNIKTGPTDLLNITSSDPGAGGTGFVSLVNGTATIPMVFSATGTQTVTAADTVDNTVSAISSGTSIIP